MPVNRSGSTPKPLTPATPSTPNKVATSAPATPSTPTPPAPGSKATSPSWSQAPDGFGQSPSRGFPQVQGQKSPPLPSMQLGAKAKPLATGLNQNSSLRPNSANQALAQQHGGVITAWVEQGSNPVVQKSSEHGGICSVMVEDWCRQGLKGPGEEQQFRNKLNSNDYASFVQDQRNASFIQQQMVKNEQFIVANQNTTLSGSAVGLYNTNQTYDRNNNVPGLTSTATVPPRPLTDHASFAGELKQQLNNNQPADGQAAFYKMGLSNGSGGHAVGIKTENMGGQLRHSVLDPNTGEFTRIPDNQFTPFMNKYMDQNYGKDYKGGTWELLNLRS
ncbi:hypothetical protein CYFUS_000206 [Cystobacter fuscus]|uniref:Peptidase C58 YopT-type domain-containing protein n=1 Tax=Cystobacter fuscus TaxID=43 RepID=A0A250ISS7_9BACT|nr:YopT-type cysteine protease domain-containing protein [Cystobacter fuscus]ATB34799.1 hypothetical protein CYFUS_000206 [Cystobacter fuscus]